MPSAAVERKIEHTLFLVSVWSKGIAGLVETIGGLLLLVIPQAKLNALVIFLTAPELAEDPTTHFADPSAEQNTQTVLRLDHLERRRQGADLQREKIPERHIGLFWYHPHAHCNVDRQMIGGLSGGILVEGSDRLYPFLKGLTERVLLLKHHPIGRADYEELVTMNGTVTPAIPIRPGEVQFWQIGNIGADRFLRLKIDGMPFYLIGRDGYFVPRPVRMKEVIFGARSKIFGNRYWRPSWSTRI